MAPLAQASFERLPIHLGTDLLIDDMTQEEASLVLNAGFMAPLMGPSDATVLRNRAAVKHRYSLPKSVSSPTEDDDEDKGVHEQVMAFFEKPDESPKMSCLHFDSCITSNSLLRERHFLS